jgi:hypothetical protein
VLGTAIQTWESPRAAAVITGRDWFVTAQVHRALAMNGARFVDSTGA